MTRVEAHKVSKKYYTPNNECIALNNINVQVDSNDFISIVGRSGAGKSTLLHILSGIKKADVGSVIIDGEDLTTLNDDKLSRLKGLKIGIVFQDSRLIEDLTVFDNIALPGYLYRKRKDVDKEALRLLDDFSMSDQKDKFPSELSAGQKQRIAFARALINDPDILFLDEPTGNLDVQTGKWIYSHLQDLNKKGKTIVMVTHDIYAASISKIVWVLSSGMIKNTISFENDTASNINDRMKKIYSSMY